MLVNAQSSITYKGFKNTKAFNLFNRNIVAFRETGIPSNLAATAIRIAFTYKAMIYNNALINFFDFGLSDKTIEHKKELAEKGLIPEEYVELPWLETGKLLTECLQVIVNNKIIKNYSDAYGLVLTSKNRKNIRVAVGIPNGMQHITKAIEKGRGKDKTVTVKDVSLDALQLAKDLEFGTGSIVPRPLFALTQRSDELRKEVLKVNGIGMKKLKSMWLDASSTFYIPRILHEHLTILDDYEIWKAKE